MIFTLFGGNASVLYNFLVEQISKEIINYSIKLIDRNISENNISSSVVIK